MITLEMLVQIFNDTYQDKYLELDNDKLFLYFRNKNIQYKTNLLTMFDNIEDLTNYLGISKNAINSFIMCHYF